MMMGGGGREEIILMLLEPTFPVLFEAKVMLAVWLDKLSSSSF